LRYRRRRRRARRPADAGWSCRRDEVALGHIK
jgi:hypothetical protein